MKKGCCAGRSGTARSLSGLLESNSFASVLREDDPTPCETVLFKNVLHNMVILMSVDLKIPALSESPVQTEAGGSFNRSV